MAAIDQKIVPHLWYNKEAKEAAGFYSSLFPGSRITSATVIHDTPSGDCDIVSFELCGRRFVAISAGPLFEFNPSISFIVNFNPLLFDPSPSREKNAVEKIDEVWDALLKGGTVLMPIGTYPFSKRYGWIQDRFGLSWQLMLTGPEEDVRPPIVPFNLFVGRNCGKAEEAIGFYLSIFRNSKWGKQIRYGPGQNPDKEGTLMFADFLIENCWFAARDSARDHKFDFNESISFMVYCDVQEEIDYYWQRLSSVPEAEQCGWLKDKYGVSWQIVPSILGEMMRAGTTEQTWRVTQAFLRMKKFNIAALQKAYDGK